MAPLLSRIRHAGDHQRPFVLTTLLVAIFVILAVLTSTQTLQSNAAFDFFFAARGCLPHTKLLKYLRNETNVIRINGLLFQVWENTSRNACKRGINRLLLAQRQRGPGSSLESPFSVPGPFTSLATCVEHRPSRTHVGNLFPDTGKPHEGGDGCEWLLFSFLTQRFPINLLCRVGSQPLSSENQLPYSVY